MADEKDTRDRDEKKPAAKKPGDEVDTFKTKKRITNLLTQIAAHRGVQKQDVLDYYEEQFENDLLQLIAKRAAELKKRKSQG